MCIITVKHYSKQKVYNLPHWGYCQCSGTSSWRSGRCFRTLHLYSCWADSRHLGTDAEWFRCSGLVQTPAQIEWDHIPSGSLLAYIPWRDARIARSWETLRGTVYIHIMMRFTEQYSLEKNSISKLEQNHVTTYSWIFSIQEKRYPASTIKVANSLFAVTSPGWLMKCVLFLEYEQIYEVVTSDFWFGTSHSKILGNRDWIFFLDIGIRSQSSSVLSRPSLFYYTPLKFKMLYLLETGFILNEMRFIKNNHIESLYQKLKGIRKHFLPSFKSPPFIRLLSWLLIFLSIR